MLRPWELNVTINRQSNIAIHLQIAHKIIEDIQSGRFTPGIALPGTRNLASKLQVNRKTVILAYDELTAQGWLTSENKRGTFVSNRTQSPHQKNAMIVPLRPTLAESTLLTNHSQNDVIHFSEGLPDLRLIPFEILSRAMRHALSIAARYNANYHSDQKGALLLREAVQQMLNIERGLHAKIDDICITRGSQMAVFLLARVLIKAGDIVVAEQLSNIQACDVFKNCGAQMHYVNHDENGLDVAQLAQLCKQQKIRAVYVSPQHQFATTVVMSQERKLQLIALAVKHDFLIIEDDSNFEFCYSSHRILPLASMQKSRQVIYIGSLSKVLSPSFRIGYLVAPKEIIQSCAKEIALIDRQGDLISELAIAEFLNSGEIKKHFLRSQKIYESRCELACKLIREELSDFVHFKQPCNGLAIWLEIHTSINLITLLKDAEIEKISLCMGSKYTYSQKPVPAIRLGFANLNYVEFQFGLLRLKAAFLKQQRKLLSA